jgi:hypothetical protein
MQNYCIVMLTASGSSSNLAMACKTRSGRGHGETVISPGLGKRGLHTGYVAS